MKTLFSTLTGIIIVIILAAIVIGFIGWSRLPDILANTLSNKLKVSVEIDDMSLGWGKIEIDKVTIGNPPGTILPKAFSCGSIDVIAPFTNYLDQKIIIDQIDLNDVYLGLEFDSAKGTEGNWTRIMSNLKPSNAQQTNNKKKKAAPPTDSGPKRSVLIKRLILTNIDVDVVYRKEGGKIQKLKRIDRIELTNVSSEGGLPMDQVMSSVLGQMLKSVFEKQNLQNMLQDLLQQQGGLQQYIEPFKGFFNTHQDAVDKEEQTA
jgi:uncharacterized protein involved in outer membrane biogenesis